MAEELKTFVCAALIFTLVQIHGIVSLQFLLNANEVLLCVGPYLSSRAGLDVILDSLPIFTPDLECYLRFG